jgi:putative Ca2+/H+ antiporter (TMEM165/GDT1 family)
MEWKLLISTFLTVFVAEIGDKTQLATFALAGGTHSRWPVFCGAVAALVLTSAIAVLAGESLAHVVPRQWLQRGAGVLFVVMGIAFLWGSRG